MPAIELGRLYETIEAELTQYSTNVREGINSAAEATAKACVSKLKASSPRKTGRYAKSWKSRKEKILMATQVIVYSSKPGLPHLLEFGHAKAGGGRAAARPHIAPVNEFAKSEFEGRVKEAIRNE